MPISFSLYFFFVLLALTVSTDTKSFVASLGNIIMCSRDSQKDSQIGSSNAPDSFNGLKLKIVNTLM